MIDLKSNQLLWLIKQTVTLIGFLIVICVCVCARAVFFLMHLC